MFSIDTLLTAVIFFAFSLILLIIRKIYSKEKHSPIFSIVITSLGFCLFTYFFWAVTLPIPFSSDSLGEIPHYPFLLYAFYLISKSIKLVSNKLNDFTFSLMFYPTIAVSVFSFFYNQKNLKQIILKPSIFREQFDTRFRIGCDFCTTIPDEEIYLAQIITLHLFIYYFVRLRKSLWSKPFYISLLEFDSFVFILILFSIIF